MNHQAHLPLSKLEILVSGTQISLILGDCLLDSILFIVQPAIEHNDSIIRKKILVLQLPYPLQLEKKNHIIYHIDLKVP